ncbi:MAG: histidine phosphatase family protein [Thermoflexales bacterium]
MPILLLIRHATNDFVKTGRLPGQGPNLHLNEEGRKQAEALASMLEKRPITAVYSSHLERAIETAWRLAGPRGLALQIRPALADTHAGDYTGRLIKELAEGEDSKEIWKAIVETPLVGRFPNGESPLDMQRRVVAELDRIVAAYPDPEPPPAPAEPPPPDAPKVEPVPPSVVAVVAHNSVVQAALAHYLGMPFENYERLGASPASVSTVFVSAKRTMVMAVNQVSPA